MTVPTKKDNHKFKLYIICASIATLLVIIGLLVRNPWSVSLYDQYSYSKTMPNIQGAAETQNPLAKGAALYNKGEYAEAKKILQQEYMMAPQNPSLSYYFAITLIETGKEYEARTVLINLSNGGSAFKYDAVFYVALSFVKQGDNTQALEWLKKIPEDQPQFAKAQSLMAELK